MKITLKLKNKMRILKTHRLQTCLYHSTGCSFYTFIFTYIFLEKKPLSSSIDQLKLRANIHSKTYNNGTGENNNFYTENIRYSLTE